MRIILSKTPNEVKWLHAGPISITEAQELLAAEMAVRDRFSPTSRDHGFEIAVLPDHAALGHDGFSALKASPAGPV